MKTQYKEIKGFPFYLMDVSEGVVYSFKNGKKKLSGHLRPDGTIVYSMQDADGRKRTIQKNRIWYACLHDIAVDIIPDDLNVVNVNGKLKLLDKQSLWRIMYTKKCENSKELRMRLLDIKEREITILRECYQSGDHTEVLRYCESLRDKLCDRFSKKYRVIRKTAEQIFDCALELMIHYIDSPTSHFSELTSCMIGLMSKEYMTRKKTKDLSIDEYFDIIKRN